MHNIHDDIKEILFTNEEIKARCKELAEMITPLYEDKNPLLMPLLKGAAPFGILLASYLNFPLEFDYAKVSSYEGTSTTGDVKVYMSPTTNFEGRHILIIEDIIDTGLTLDAFIKQIEKKNPASIKVIALCNKKERRIKQEIKADYVGFEIPNKFVVGFGLDYNQQYRQLDYIGVLKEEIYK